MFRHPVRTGCRGRPRLVLEPGLLLGQLVKRYARRRVVRRGVAFRTDTYQVGDHLIWGATARIVGDLLERLRPVTA